MNKDEMKNKCAERAKIFQQAMKSCKSSNPIDCVEWFADRIYELEEKISVLLSCKNCPENKGGYICEKEYENKCLTQKIQYIKELKEENENLKKTYRKQRNKRIDDLQKENAELKKQLEMSNKVYNDNCDYSHHIEGQLTKAKRYIKELLKAVESSYSVLSWQRPPIKAEAEQFLKDCEVEK